MEIIVKQKTKYMKSVITLLFTLNFYLLLAQVPTNNYKAKTTHLILSKEKNDTLFFDNFENKNLKNWKDTNHWTASNQSPISDNYSLKHNVNNQSGVSFISATYKNADFNAKNTIWQLQLKNGNFNPSSSNQFAYILMSDGNNLTENSLNGYAVGVNYSGSTDKLCLWRVDSGKKTLLLTSDFLWKENSLASIKITRDVAGNWKLGVVAGNQFKDLAYTNSIKDDKYNYPNHGLFFKYSKTRAGMLQADNICCYQESTPPKVLEAKAKDAKKILVVFSQKVNQADAENIANYSLKNEGKEPINLQTAQLNTSNNTEVFLNVIDLKTDTYTLIVQNIKNTEGLVMPAPQTLTFSYLETANETDVVISEIMADPTPSQGLPEYEYIEITNVSNKSIELKDWQIAIKNTKKVLSKYLLKPNEKLILCTTKAYEELKQFGTTLSIKSFPALPNSGALIELFNSDNKLINSVKYTNQWYKDSEKAKGGYSLEKIDLNNNCGGEQNWTASTNENGGTPGETNAVNAVNIDNIAPKVKIAAPISDTIIKIKFSETIEKNSLTNSANYKLNGQETKLFAIDSVKYSWVKIKTNKVLDQQKNYQIRIQNIVDKCDNLLADTTIDFSYTVPHIYQIVINEIMANPTPAVGLPEVEYIELYNNSKTDLHLFDWTIIVGKSARKIPYIFFKKDSYLVLCKSEYKTQLQTYGKTVGVEKLSALPLDGSIKLMDNKGLVICVTDYSSSWITDDFKSEGGYSLERIDVNNFNENKNNWQVSYSTNGGTPCQKNSVAKENPDTKKFNLVRVVPIDSLKINALFDKAIDASSVKLNNFVVSPQLNLPDSVKLMPPHYKTIQLFYTKPLEKNTRYTLTVKDLKDLSGYPIQRNIDEFMLSQLATKNSLVINEVLFDPNPDGVEFIELYNRSEYAVNLSQLIIALRNDKNEIKSPYRILSKGEIVLPKEYKLISVNSEKIKLQYTVNDEFALVEVKKLPSLANDKATIVLMDTIGTIIDEFTYTNKMHFGLLENTKGISLERISSERPTNEKGNWHSAAQQIGWATPGYKNSVSKITEETEEEVAIEPEAFSPDNDGYNDILNIHYHFDKVGYVANIRILDKRGMKIRDLVKNELLAQKGIITWDGLTDYQSKAGIGIYIVLFEVFDENGKIKTYKKSCVVSTKF